MAKNNIQRNIEPSEYIRIVLTRIKLILLLTVIAVVVATAGAFLKKPIYKATTTVLIKSALTQPKSSTQSAGYTPVQDIIIKGETFGMILKSRTVAEKIVDSLGLGNGKNDTLGRKAVLAKQIQASITTSLVPKTTIFEISVSYLDPVMAAEIANTAAKVFVTHIKNIFSAEARAVKEFIADRVGLAEEELMNTQDDLRQFIISEGAVYPESQTNLVLAEYVRFQSALKSTDVDIEQTKKRISELKKQLSGYEEFSKSSTTYVANPIVGQLKSQLVTLETELARISVDYGPLHPKSQAVTEEIEQIRQSLASEIGRTVQSEVVSVNPLYRQLLSDLMGRETDLEVFQKKRMAIDKVIHTFPKELMKSAEKQIIWDMLITDVKFSQKALDSLKTQLETARITEAQKISEIRVIDAALPPRKPKGIPRVGYSLLGLITGLLGGVLLSLFLEYIDDSIKSIETVEEELGMSVYGVIPEIRPEGKGRRWWGGGASGKTEASIIEERLVTHFESKSPIAEAYRSLRTNIQFAGLPEGSTTLMVTSSLKGEGKTTTAANLAVTMAQLDNRTLLVDADMRSPMINTVFEVPREPGLSNIIGGSSPLADVIKPSGIDMLDLVTSGPVPPNPSELLSSNKLDEMIKEASRSYDFIIFDTPPVVAVTDAAVLSSRVNGVFIVIHSGRTGRRICLRARSLLDKVSSNLLGAVLNNVKVESRYGYEYYYQYYYGDKGKSRGR